MKPLCLAPFTAVLIDPDKGIRPCCSYLGSVGNLLETGIQEILNGASWKSIEAQLEQQQVPEGCRICMERERLSGFSYREWYETTQNGLTFLEIKENDASMQRNIEAFIPELVQELKK